MNVKMRRRVKDNVQVSSLKNSVVAEATNQKDTDGGEGLRMDDGKEQLEGEVAVRQTVLQKWASSKLVEWTRPV